MPLFEVEGERPQLVAGPRPGVGTTAHRVVESHIDGLLGEQVFPVSQGNGPDQPHLLALDASGSPVVVELVSRLDEAALTRALDHAGAAGRMTRGQLASMYAGGPQAFQRDVATFYDSVPVTRSQTGQGGARLIVICQDADQDVLNAVDFLRQPSMPVEVLRLGVVHAADGRRFVDVSPLVIHPASAPDRPELMGSVSSPARPAVAAPVDRLDAVPLPGVSTTPPDDVAPVPAPPAPVPAPPAPVPPAPPAATAPERPSRATRRRSRTDRFSAQETTAEIFADYPEPERLPFEPLREPAATWEPARTWDPHSGEEPIPLPSDREREAIEFGEVLSEISAPLDPGWQAGHDHDPLAWEAPFEPPRVATPPVPPAPQPWDPPSAPMVVDEDVDTDLAALAAAIGAGTVLVWERPRRGQRFEAYLHPDGSIEVPDGSRYRHPDVAATAVSGSYTADGWTVWRLGSATGPTLTEAFRTRFA